MEPQQELNTDRADEAIESLEARTHGRKAEPHLFSVTIGKPVEEVFRFWRDFKNLPKFMKDLYEVQEISDKKSHWIVRLKSGLQFEWDAEITDEIPDQLIAWKSLGKSVVEMVGTVTFEPAPANRGTIVHLVMNYHIPGGKVGELAGKVTGEDPTNLTLTNLRRLKAYLETGEIPTTEGQPSGRDEDLKENSNLH
jgi:uncharacterized membrane protein